MSQPVQRPPLTGSMTAAELARWYWRIDELQQLARTLGVRTGGGKELLTRRLSAALDGVPFTEPDAARSASPAPQLSGHLTADTVIPRGQRCSQHLRQWFADRVGQGFRFDAAMRGFIAASDGTQTLGDALRHWHTTRATPSPEITAQFELNRFTRAWHQQHPEGTRDQLLAAWEQYRATPVERRGRA